MAYSSPLHGMGKVAMWGMSPACDLLELIDKKKLEPSSDEDKKEINILLVGQSDIRHILQTLKSQRKTLKENGVHVNFYVVESCLELYARQILFWKIAFEPLNQMGLHEKTVQYMELLGNTLIRPKTRGTVISFSDILINILTEGTDTSAQMMPLLDFSEVKYRERDGIVEIIKFWRDFSSTKEFDMSIHWNYRVRHNLGTRYDSRIGVFDWDYHTKLVEKGITIIGSAEYKNWRDTGVAFNEYDSDYSQPNLTLASVCSETRGFSGVRTSYWGDIITGPFICHGIECDDKSLFEKSGGLYKKKSYDVTYRNLEEIFTFTSKLSLPIVETTSDTNENDKGSASCHNQNFAIHFVSLQNFLNFPAKSKYKEFFDVVYFGNSMVHHMLPRIRPIFAPDAIVMAESACYAFELRPEKEELFTTKVNELATNIGLEPVETIGINECQPDETGTEGGPIPQIKPSILKFVMKLQNANEKSSDVEAAVTSNSSEVESPQILDPQPQIQNLGHQQGGDAVTARKAEEESKDLKFTEKVVSPNPD